MRLAKGGLHLEDHAVKLRSDRTGLLEDTLRHYLSDSGLLDADCATQRKQSVEKYFIIINQIQ